MEASEWATGGLYAACNPCMIACMHACMLIAHLPPPLLPQMPGPNTYSCYRKGSQGICSRICDLLSSACACYSPPAADEPVSKSRVFLCIACIATGHLFYIYLSAQDAALPGGKPGKTRENQGKPGKTREKIQVTHKISSRSGNGTP